MYRYIFFKTYFFRRLCRKHKKNTVLKINEHNAGKVSSHENSCSRVQSRSSDIAQLVYSLGEIRNNIEKNIYICKQENTKNTSSPTNRNIKKENKFFFAFCLLTTRRILFLKRAQQCVLVCGFYFYKILKTVCKREKKVKLTFFRAFDASTWPWLTLVRTSSVTVLSPGALHLPRSVRSR